MSIGARTLARAGVLALCLAGLSAASPVADAATPGQTIDYWVAAVPVTWNITPERA